MGHVMCVSRESRNRRWFARIGAPQWTGIAGGLDRRWETDRTHVAGLLSLCFTLRIYFREGWELFSDVAVTSPNTSRMMFALHAAYG